MREKLIAANWKMYKNALEAKNFIDELTKLIPVHHERYIHIFPQLVIFESLKTAITSHHYRIGAQNCFYEEEGAFTGEVSPKTLKDLNIFSCLVGHSERRQYFRETNESCSRKIHSLLKNNLTPIYCIGETQDERDSKQTQTILKKQILEGLKNCDLSKNIVIAYEPVWAIGTGNVASPAQAQEAHLFIRKTLKDLAPESDFTIIYGGSVKPENVLDLIKEPDIDGFLVGGASLKASSFAEICKAGLSGVAAVQNVEKKVEI